jgi:hypothetical protein
MPYRRGPAFAVQVGYDGGRGVTVCLLLGRGFESCVSGSCPKAIESQSQAVSIGAILSPLRKAKHHLYPVVIEQVLDVDSLAELSDTAANEADENGYLAGNQMYQDLRGYGWPDVARALRLERRLIAKLQEAEDLDAEAMLIDDERLDCFEPSDGLWGLDLGVAWRRKWCGGCSALPWRAHIGNCVSAC